MKERCQLTRSELARITSRRPVLRKIPAPVDSEWHWRRTMNLVYLEAIRGEAA